jgi:NitT/TauT family transport system substrate-binding protein
MMLTSLQKRGLSPNFWNLVSQSPEVGSTNLQEKRIDAHGDFVPFTELLPFKGFARKIYDGAETRAPTFHGIVIRKDFGEKYPEIVVAYLKALIDANDWIRKDPKAAAENVEAWTRISKEVVYIFLGPGGVHTLDPTIKKPWVDAVGDNYAILRKLNMIKELNVGAWVDDSYLRETYKELGLDYEQQLASFDTYNVTGIDQVCNAPVDNPKLAGEVWIQGGDIVPFRSPLCTLLGVTKYAAEGKKFNAVYLVDHELGIKVFADAAFYAVEQDSKKTDVVPFLLKKDAEAYATKNGGKLATYAEALNAVNIGK